MPMCLLNILELLNFLHLNECSRRLLVLNCVKIVVIFSHIYPVKCLAFLANVCGLQLPSKMIVFLWRIY
jgi:hypothetical protein